MKGPCCRREKRGFGFLAWGNDASVLNVNRTGGDDGQKLGTHACCRVLITRLRASIECIYDTTSSPRMCIKLMLYLFANVRYQFM